jgi:hypothetical protein
VLKIRVAMKAVAVVPMVVAVAFVIAAAAAEAKEGAMTKKRVFKEEWKRLQEED